MVNAKPPDEFIKICVRFVVVDLPDSSQHSANDNFRPSEQSRGWPVDRTEFRKDVAPPIHARLRDA